MHKTESACILTFGNVNPTAKRQYGVMQGKNILFCSLSLFMAELFPVTGTLTAESLFIIFDQPWFENDSRQQNRNTMHQLKGILRFLLLSINRWRNHCVPRPTI